MRLTRAFYCGTATGPGCRENRGAVGAVGKPMYGQRADLWRLMAQAGLEDALELHTRLVFGQAGQPGQQLRDPRI